jgi:hypothetical protein
VVETGNRLLQTVGGDGAQPRGASLHELADLSLAEYFRQLARYGGETADEDGLLLFLGAHAQPNPYRNGAIRLAEGLTASELTHRAQRFFAGRRSSYCLWVREHADGDLEALTAGCQELERLPQMVLRAVPERLPVAPGVQLRRATDDATRRDYLEVVANAWGMRAMPLDVAARVFFDPASLQEPAVAAFVAYYEDQPLSAAMTLVTHGVALGCQAATIRRPRPGQRLPPATPGGERRGLAEACLVEALHLSFQSLGATLSLCQTSSAGAPVWLALGYVPFTSYGRYLMPVSPARRPAAASGGGWG